MDRDYTEKCLDGSSERALVIGSRAGDRRAYGELARRHYRRVLAVCLGVLTTGLAAIGVPAWRAVRTDPARTLRLPSER